MKLTFKILAPHAPCAGGLRWYKKHKSPGTVELCVKNLLADAECCERFNYANWLLSEMLSVDDKVKFAIFAAEQVVVVFEMAVLGDLRPRKAIEAAKKYLKVKTSSAAGDARDAGDAAGAAAWAAWAARAARDAGASAGAAAGAARAARDAGDAARAARAARDAGDAAGAARDAMLEKIINYGLTLITCGGREFIEE
jgi:hypothetical protein